MVIRYLISIRNIPWIVSHLDLEKYFSAFGNIKYAKVIFDKSGLNTGYGFVEFYDRIAMRRVLNTTHILEQQRLFVRQGLHYLETEEIQQFVRKYMPHECLNPVNNQEFKNNSKSDYQTKNKKHTFPDSKSSVGEEHLLDKKPLKATKHV